MKKRFILFLMNFWKFQTRCRTCTCKLDALRTGIRGTKTGIRWTYWCYDCYMNNFIRDVNSSPALLSNYYSIHGKSPEEVLEKCN